MHDPDVPGEVGSPKPVEDSSCCNYYSGPGKILLYALRHGSTEANEANLFRGWSEFPLDDKGRDDAYEAAEYLSDKGVSMIYCSDLGRAYETAKIVGEVLGLDVTCDFRLRGWDIGVLAGKDRDEYADVLEDAIDNPSDPLEDGESLDEFGDRTQQAIEYYLDEARKEGTKLLVFHTSNVVQLENYCAGEGADGRPESKDSVMPGGIMEVSEKNGKLSTKVVLKENSDPKQYGS